MLYAAPIPLVAGTAAPIQNVATAENKGLEFGTIFRKSLKGLKYSLGGNIAFVESRITGLGRGGEPVNSGYVQFANADAARTDVGQPLGSFLVMLQTGFFKISKKLRRMLFRIMKLHRVISDLKILMVTVSLI